jgi:hypothetical protein
MSWWDLGKSKNGNSKNSSRSSSSSSKNKRDASAWKSIKSACEQYGLTKEDFRSADPPITCKWRRSNGRSSALVKLSDIAALKQNINISRQQQQQQQQQQTQKEKDEKKKKQQQQAQKEKDERKKKKDEKMIIKNSKKKNKKLLVDATKDSDILVMKAAEKKFGQEGCDKILKKSNVVKKAAAKNHYYRRRKSTIEDLIDKLDIANSAALISGSSFENGTTVSIADTLDGMTISEKKAKKEWYITNVDGLYPVEDDKDNHSNRKKNKKKYYHLSDVIGRAIKTAYSQQPQTTATSHQSKEKNQQQLIVSRILKCPKTKRLYARYLFDQFEDACQNVDDPSIIREVYEFRKKRHQQRDDEFFQKKRKTSE